MVERARAGVEVRLTLDAVGSALMFGAPLRRLREAGCKVNFYQPITLVPASPPEQPDAPRAAGRRRTRRVHRRRRRRRLVAEAATAAIPRGATRWRASRGRSSRRCRASSPRTGSSAAARSSRRRATGPRLTHGGHRRSDAGEELAVRSRDRLARRLSDAHRRGRHEHRHPDAVLPAGQVAAARAGPRRAARRQSARHRPRAGTRDQRLVRLASRRMYRELLEGGVRIFEYRPAMTHVKALMVDERVGDRRHDKCGQPFVRAQRRSQRCISRNAGDRSPAARFRVGPGGERRNHARAMVQAARARKTHRAGVLDSRASTISWYARC